MKDKKKKVGNDQKEITKSDSNRVTDHKDQVSRRNFLGKAGILGAGLFVLPNVAGNYSEVSAQIMAEEEVAYCPNECELAPAEGIKRRDLALKIRETAASEQTLNMTVPNHPCNGDDQLYSNQNYFASFTKGIKRAQTGSAATFGLVDSAEYCKLLKALESGNPADYEKITLGLMQLCLVFQEPSNSAGEPSDAESRLSTSGGFVAGSQRRLSTPQAGSNFDLEGKDYYQLIAGRPRKVISQPTLAVTAFPVAPNFNSRMEVAEIVELYWQALTRDVPFINYQSDYLVAQAAADLNTHFKPYYDGPRDANGNITPWVYSRGILKGDTKGPFLSQFFLRDVPYGVQTIEAKIHSPEATIKNDFMTDETEWLNIQKGQTPDPQNRTVFDGKRFIRSGRDLAEFVHNDAIYQTYLNAALIMLVSSDAGGLGVPVDTNNPYRPGFGYCKQDNFVEFGPSQLLSLLGEVSVRSHKAVWYQKWNVHRRLRPEEFGGRIHHNQRNNAGFPINDIIWNSSVFDKLRWTFETDNLFLPQAFPEGSPMHPSYGAGHATLAGAAVTILKAWFDSEQPFSRYGQFFQPSADGLSLVPSLTRTDSTVADELNKLASNVSLARNIAGVHWRSDYTESIFLGEQVAINLLRDYGYTYNENFNGFTFRNFAGTLLTGVGKKITV